MIFYKYFLNMYLKTPFKKKSILHKHEFLQKIQT